MSFALDKEKTVEKIREALALGKKRRFLQSVDATIVLKNIDLRSPDARLRETVYLPHKPNKKVNICVVAEGDMALKARDMGLRVIGRQELQGIERKQAKRIAQQCDWVLVQVPLMGLAGRFLGPVLGPRGKIPIPVPPTANIEDIVERFERAVMVRISRQPQVSMRIGTEDMEPEKLYENLLAVLNTIQNRLGADKVGKVIVKKTMGIPVRVL